MELLLDRANPLHWVAVLVLALSGAAYVPATISPSKTSDGVPSDE